MRLTLAHKFAAIIVGVVTLAVLSSIVALLSTWKIGSLMQDTINESLPSVQVAQELQLTLCEPRGLMASYILDGGNRLWLGELQEQKRRFADGLAKAKITAHTPEEKESLVKLEAAYRAYNVKRGEVLVLYHEGETEKAKVALFGEVNERYMRAHDLCDGFIDATSRCVAARLAESQDRVRQVSWIVGACVALTVALGMVLLWLFFRGVLWPLRQMVADARVFAGDDATSARQRAQNELCAVKDHLCFLMSNVTTARSALEHSRSELTHAEERLASVGKLAACVAHEIRNPLCAITLCLHSLRETVGTNAEADGNFEIASEEIARLDNIIKHFLEFSRPPRLNIHRQDVAAVVDKTVSLLRLPMEEKAIRLVREQSANLPPILADAEQLKQVLINILKNATEATPEGGEVRITTGEETAPDGRVMVVIRIQDTGPGIPTDVRERIFEPFFTTKQTGTGLGLCIAARVMAQHGGQLTVESSSDQGTVFAARIPAAQPEADEDDLHNEQYDNLVLQGHK
ncbi:MAG: ATP-binding protein [Pirellulales bacterium]